MWVWAEAGLVFEATTDLPQKPVTFAAEFVSATGQKTPGTGRLDLYITPRLKTPVKIDGRLDDWTDVKPAKLTGKDHLKEWTGGSFKGDEDTMVTFYTKWDPQHLYFAFEVRDDKFFHSPHIAYFMGDSIQLYFDTRHDGTTEESRAFDDNDYVYNIWRVGEVVHLSRTYVPLFELCGVRGGKVHQKEVPRAVVRTGNKTIYELAFPQSSLRPFKIEPGTVLSASFIVNDNDGAVDNRMRGRDKSITLTPKDTEPFQNAHLFSDFLLAE